jgi:death-on-curing protein
MKKLTKEQVLLLHHSLIDSHGGSLGIRDEGLLDSALDTPFQTFEGEYLLPTIQQKAVRLGFGLIMNHPFVDGNKRIGTHVMLTILAMNNIELDYTQKELYEIILDVAAGKASFDELLHWVLGHEIDKNEIRAQRLIETYGFDFDNIPRDEIRQLLNNEIQNFVTFDSVGCGYYSGSSEYFRVLCGYLFCIGNPKDIEIIEKTKYINMDIGCMIDSEWVNSMKGIQDESTCDRNTLINNFVEYYNGYFDL